jgi:hypothetical protein
METRHDTSLLEKAVGLVVEQAAIPTKRAEAEASFQVARATGLRRVATGGAVAIGAVGIGLAAWLALNQPLQKPEQMAAKAPPEVDQTKTESIPERQTSAYPAPAQKTPSATQPDPNPESAGNATSSPAPSGGPTSSGAPREAGAGAPHVPIPMPAPRPDIITTNFTKFVNRTTYLQGRMWKVEAGHHFTAETDANWSFAWCYTRVTVDGVSVGVDLANRSTPGSPPSTGIATRQTLAKAGLDDARARELAAKCPWLDGKSFGVSDDQPPPRPKPPAETKVVQQVL